MLISKLPRISRTVIRPADYGQVNRKAYSSNVATRKSSVDEVHDIDSFKLGKNVHGFNVTNVQRIQEFNLLAVLLKHDVTRAEYLHLYRNDNNNVFAVNFRTTPRDSTGLPHILEHTVLCGSQMFPIRDPFFKMLNRSLATFMNAMTGSDCTFYPFSTQNYSDYRNLQKIYLDAAFRPNIKLLDFMQEGWRLENKDPADKNSEIIIKGVVYNEMKGVFSENDSILSQNIQNRLLPDHTYGVVSGGDPLKIPNLTWENLKKFHADHYHPSNARFYSYGNFPLTPTLEYLSKTYLDDMKYKSPQHTEVPPTARWTEPKKEHIVGRYHAMREPIEKQNVVSISLAMTDITDAYETLLLQFISELLIRGPSAPFYKSLIEPNFSGGFTPNTGFDAQSRDSIFILGLQGVQTTDYEKVEDIFDETIEKVIETGFDKNHVESVLHRYELSIKHETSNFGLNILFGIVAPWTHGADVINMLKVNQLITKLKDNMAADAKYLQNTVKKYFQSNNHRLVLTMSPDKEYDAKQTKQEAEIIKSKVGKLSSADKEDIFKKGQELLSEQKKEQDVNILPTLRMQDIISAIDRPLVEECKLHRVPTSICMAHTNGLTYFRGMLNTSHLTPEQQMLLPLFCYVISKLGTNRMNYVEFDNFINRKTGGLNISVHTGDSLYQLHTYEPTVMISSYCLPENIEDMYDIWSQLFGLTELKDVERFKMLVKLYMSQLTSGIADSGHIYAMSTSAGIVSATAYQRDLLNGLPHIQYMKRLVKTNSYEPMLKEVSNIGRAIFDTNYMRCSLNIVDKKKALNKRLYEHFLTQLPHDGATHPHDKIFTTSKVWSAPDAINCHHHILNSSVNFCSRAVLTVPFTHADFAPLKILSRLVTAKYLHPELRERHGAYGGGVRLERSGALAFYSYRDPRNIQTLDIFDESASWFKAYAEKVTEQELLEAKLGVFQTVDAPVPPYRVGADAFINGVTSDVLQRHRAELMAVSVQSLQAVAEKYLTIDAAHRPLNGKAILGPKDIKTDSRRSELWTVFESES